MSEAPRSARGWRRLLPGLIGWRLVLLLLPALFAVLQLAPFSASAYFANFHGSEATPPTFATRWATWDAQHYLFIARHGYIAGHVSSAFWPLWPGLVRAVSRVTTAPALPVALGLANLLALAATIGLWQLVRARADSSTATWSVLLALAFPSAFFLALPYSEALFLALTIGLFLALDRGRLGWAALAAFALPLTRPVGLFILLPLAAWLRQPPPSSPARLPGGDDGARPAVREKLGPALLLLAPVAGFVAYFGIHLLATGDPSGAFGVRGVFASGQSVRQLLDLPGFLRAAFAVDSLHSVTGSVLDRCLFVLALVALPWLHRRDRVLFWYLLPMALVPALSLRFMAFGRFALVLFPLFWAGAEALAGTRRAVLRWAVVAVALTLQLWLYFRHSLNLWAG